MFTLWNSLIQCKIDYCSQLWNPSDQVTISKLEGVARSFTCRITEMDNMNYWERLEQLGMHSQERRRERYQIISIWKILQGLVIGYTLQFQHSDRRGLYVTVPTYGITVSSFCEKSQRSFSES